MAHILKSALLPFSAEQMYHLVNDVAAYPTYIDGCIGAEIIEQSDVHMVARLDLGIAGIKQSFTTRNSLKPYSEIILVLEEGPFADFAGGWQFHALTSHACKVEFDLRFQASTRLVNKAIEKMLGRVANSMVSSLSARARLVYGENEL